MKRFEYMGSDGKLKRLDLISPITMDAVKAMAENKPFEADQIKKARNTLLSFGATTKKRKVNVFWTCSDFVHHEHRTRLGAWLCGRWQSIVKMIARR